MKLVSMTALVDQPASPHLADCIDTVGERIAAVLAHMEERLAWYQEQIGINEEELARLLSAGKSGGADA